MQEGWLCPKCKTIYSPSITQCSCSKSLEEHRAEITDYFNELRKINKQRPWPKRMDGLDSGLFTTCFS